MTASHPAHSCETKNLDYLQSCYLLSLILVEWTETPKRPEAQTELSTLGENQALLLCTLPGLQFILTSLTSTRWSGCKWALLFTDWSLECPTLKKEMAFWLGLLWDMGELPLDASEKLRDFRGGLFCQKKKVIPLLLFKFLVLLPLNYHILQTLYM